MTTAFQGGKKARSVTQKHTPLIWECMLGTVYARNWRGEVKYFDYDYEAAHVYAGVKACADLRITKNPTCRMYSGGYPNPGQVALWGVRPR